MDFVSRLRTFMASQGVSNSQFADTCGIPRPTLSQILAGRNKKISDELIGKIHAAYPWLNVMWLLFGEGIMTIGPNMRTSEAQNRQNEGHTDSYTTDRQSFYDKNNISDISIDFGSDNLRDANTHDNSQQIRSDNRYAVSDTHDNRSYISGTPIDNTDQTQSSKNIDNSRQPGIRDNSYYPTGVANQDVRHSSSYSDIPDDTLRIRTGEDTHPDDISPVQRTFIENAARIAGVNINHKPEESPRSRISVPAAASKRITSIVVFYDDSSFESFTPTAD